MQVLRLTIRKTVKHAPHIASAGIATALVGICILNWVVAAIGVVLSSAGLFSLGFNAGLRKTEEYLEKIDEFIIYVPRDREVLLAEGDEIQDLDDGFDPDDIEEEEEYELDEEEEEEEYE